MNLAKRKVRRGTYRVRQGPLYTSGDVLLNTEGNGGLVDGVGSVGLRGRHCVDYRLA